MQWTFRMAFEVVFREMLCHHTKLNTCSQQIVKVGKSCDLCSERQTNCKLKEVAETCEAKRRYSCGDLDIEFAGIRNLFAKFPDLKSLQWQSFFCLQKIGMAWEWSQHAADWEFTTSRKRKIGTTIHHNQPTNQTRHKRTKSRKEILLC